MGLDRDLIDRIRKLDGHDLRRVVILATGFLASREGPQAMATPVQPARRPRPSFRQQWVRCGKPACTTCPHGPYWYAYWREDGRLRSRYVGKELPEATDGPGQLEGAERPERPSPDRVTIT